MANISVLASLGLIAGTVAQSTVGAYGQCGGSSYTGPTVCGSGYTCTEYNPYYEQCVPGATSSAPIASSSTSSPSTTTALSTTSTSTPTASSSGSSPTTTAPSSIGTGTGTPTTLVSGWYWIRAVESPYYHSYLQTLPTATPGDALMDDASTAGQFNIINGQLVYYTGSSAPLYMWVEDPVDKTQRALATWFNSTASSYGNFSFSGDTVTWTDPDVVRPNAAAFYVCLGNGTGTAGENALFVNTGAYLYETPSGCYDIDIHSYGGSTATV